MEAEVQNATSLKRYEVKPNKFGEYLGKDTEFIDAKLKAILSTDLIFKYHKNMQTSADNVNLNEHETLDVSHAVSGSVTHSVMHAGQR